MPKTDKTLNALVENEMKQHIIETAEQTIVLAFPDHRLDTRRLWAGIFYRTTGTACFT